MNVNISPHEIYSRKQNNNLHGDLIPKYLLKQKNTLHKSPNFIITLTARALREQLEKIAEEY